MHKSTRYAYLKHRHALQDTWRVLVKETNLSKRFKFQTNISQDYWYHVNGASEVPGLDEPHTSFQCLRKVTIIND